MDIENQEKELKDLLNRVMREPLLPLQIKLDTSLRRMEDIEAQYRALRDIELGGIVLDLEALDKKLTALSRWTESAVDEIKQAVLPPVQQAAEGVGQRMYAATESLLPPVQKMGEAVAEVASSVERLSCQSEQAYTQAAHRDAGLDEQVRNASSIQLEQLHSMQQQVRQAIEAAVEFLSQQTLAANVAQAVALRQMVDAQVSERIDRLAKYGRWMIGLATVVAAVALVSIGLLLRSSH